MSRPVGRPRQAATERAILEATLHLMVEGGQHNVTTDAVARRARTSKAAIYRRWRSRETLMISALDLISAQAADVPVPDTGTIRGDLVAFAESLSAAIATRLLLTALSLANDVIDDPERRAAIQHYLDQRTPIAHTILRRAAARGEIRSDVDTDALLDCLAGGLYRDYLRHGRPADTAAAERFVDILLPGITGR